MAPADEVLVGLVGDGIRDACCERRGLVSQRAVEERAAVYLRPDAETSAVLRRLHRDGVQIGVFTDAPAALAWVALAQLGAARRIAALETGADALPRLLARFGEDTRVVRTRDQLLGLR